MIEEQTNNATFSWLGRIDSEYRKCVFEHNKKFIYGEGFNTDVFSPCDSRFITSVCNPIPTAVEKLIADSEIAFNEWKSVPAPKRAECIRRFAQVLRREKPSLAEVITMETGKTITESLGEVQEMIDICDFAVGLSRQLHGLTIASERKEHKLTETWHPVGPVAVISAFNFPAAVWAWNFALAVVCGNSVIWKPSEKTPITAIVCNALFDQVSPIKNLSTVITGGKDTAVQIAGRSKVKMVSATGSTEMGREIQRIVGGRFGKCLLELGGNNAGIVTPSADFDTAISSVAFAATGTTGQRCTTMRRLFVHSSIYDNFVSQLRSFYINIIFPKIGDPFSKDTLIGPLVDRASGACMHDAIVAATSPTEGGKLLAGGGRQAPGAGGFYVAPAIVEMPSQTNTVKKETFAPILYVMKYDSIEEAIKMQNDVPQGLSSCIFTTDMREAELFLSERGSDCGLANVNIGTSGAEIGGAFGGEKETGGGRESGSDAWKNYMRRQTATINYSYSKPQLSQGITFE